MAKKEFLMLAHKYKEGKTDISGWYMSEKLDGMRALWDGGITIDKPLGNVSWANIEKDNRYLNKDRRATGLWSRYRKPIYAPEWFIKQLPLGICLDGELWGGHGNFQKTISTVKNLVPDDRGWEDILFMAFDSPSRREVFGTPGTGARIFEDTYKFLKTISLGNNLSLLEQVQLPLNKSEALEQMTKALAVIIDVGGEGIMLRHPTSFWVNERTHKLLKVKLWEEGQGTVISYTWGKETALGSKLLGKMGALVLSFRGKRFELGGFTEEEREFVGEDVAEEGVNNAGKEVNLTKDIKSKYFSLGTLVKFRYRELTDSGIPKEARYSRSS